MKAFKKAIFICIVVFCAIKAAIWIGIYFGFVKM